MANKLDVTGLLCPVPLLMTARVAAALPTGERLEVIGDDPDLAPDLRRWCEEAGHRLLEIQCEDRRTRVTIELGAGTRGAMGAARPEP